jgi:hypothetical protein
MMFNPFLSLEIDDVAIHGPEGFSPSLIGYSPMGEQDLEKLTTGRLRTSFSLVFQGEGAVRDGDSGEEV